MTKIIRTFQDIKDVLNNVPDELLEVLGFGTGEGSEETIGVVAWSDDYPAIFDKIDKKYPELNEVFNLIDNIKEAQEKLDEQEDRDWEENIAEEGINSNPIKLKDELQDLVKEKLRKDRRRGKGIKFITSRRKK